MACITVGGKKNIKLQHNRTERRKLLFREYWPRACFRKGATKLVRRGGTKGKTIPTPRCKVKYKKTSIKAKGAGPHRKQGDLQHY